jgi:hypothetical protein
LMDSGRSPVARQLPLFPETGKHIVSVSRRTDIPAFYTPWFLERVRQGSCLVPNPCNAAQVSRISLRPEDVACIVFWTRNPRPLLPYLPDLERAGLPPAFLFTLTGYPRMLEPHRPAIGQSLEAFQELAVLLGPERVTWRYDPVVLSTATDVDYHLENFATLAEGLRGAASRVVVSLLEVYRKNRPGLRALARGGVDLLAPTSQDVERLFAGLAATAEANGMRIQACAQGGQGLGPEVPAGACIDAPWLEQGLGVALPRGKDPAQREHCLCLRSRDVGMYDSCVFGCRYCYATTSLERAQANRLRHNPKAESLLAGGGS